MKRPFLILLLSLVFYSNVNCNGKSADYYLVDSLNLEELSNREKRIIDSSLVLFYSAKNDTSKANIMLDLVSRLKRRHIWSKYNDWLYEFCKERIGNNNIKERKLYTYIIAECLIDFGYIAQLEANSRESIRYFKKSIEYHEKIGNKKGIASCYNNLGYVYRVEGKTDLVLPYYYKSLKIRNSIRDTLGIAISLNNIGYFFYEHGEGSKALKYFILSLKLREKIGGGESIPGLLNNIGLCYRQQLDFKNAIFHFNKSLKIEKDFQNKKGIGVILSNIGTTYHMQDSLYKALNYYKISLKELYSFYQKDEISSVDIYKRMADIYLSWGKNDTAIFYGNKALAISEEFDFKEGIGTSLNIKAKISLSNGKLEEAEELANISLKIGREIKFKTIILEAIENLQGIYEKKGDWENALEYNKRSISIRDSLRNPEIEKSLIHQQDKYEYEKQKALEEEIYKKQISLEKKELEKQVFLTRISFFGLLVIMLFFVYSYSRYRIVKKQKKLIEKQNKLVNKTLSKLSRNKIKYENIVKNTIDVIYQTDFSGNFTYVNDLIESVTGYTNEEFLKLNFRDIIRSDYSEKVDEIYVQNWKNSGFINNYVELPIICKDKTEKWIGQKVNPIYEYNDPTRIAFFQSVARDITIQKKAEWRNEKMIEYFEFLRYLGNELIKEEEENNLIKKVIYGIESLFPTAIKCSFIYFDFMKDSANYFRRGKAGEEVDFNGVFTMPFSDFGNLDEMRGGKCIYNSNLVNKQELSVSDKRNISEGIKSYILVPLMNLDNLYGAVAVGFTEVNSLTAIEESMFQELGILVSTILLKNRLLKEINEQHKELIDGIEYARRIQQTILPNEKKLKNYFEDYFIMYKPKEIVSGDFYWFSYFPNSDKRAVFGVFDCTGHGVPGSLLSMIGSRFLNDSVRLNHQFDTDIILNELNREIKNRIFLRDRSLHDGMDAALCSFDKDTGKMRFSGAINSLIIIRGEECIEYKGNLWSIGENNNDYSFYEFDVEAGDKYYLFSDGYSDQLGGKKDKKIMKKNFRNILLKNSHLTMKEQKEKLIEFHEKWQGSNGQTDDITILGFTLLSLQN